LTVFRWSQFEQLGQPDQSAHDGSGSAGEGAPCGPAAEMKPGGQTDP
jgi:hypothetical protein